VTAGRDPGHPTGRLVVVQYAGQGPVKVEQRVEVTLAQGLVYVQAMEVSSKEEADVSTALSAAKSVASDQNIVVAFPRLVVPPSGSPDLEVDVRGPPDPTTGTEPAWDFVRLGSLVFQEHMKSIWGRTVARAVVKFLLALGAQKAGEAAGGKKYGWITGFLAGAATRAAFGALEHADTRIWGTLPAQVRLAVIELPAGLYSVHVRGNLVRGAPGTWNARVVEGRSTYLFVRTW